MVVNWLFNFDNQGEFSTEVSPTKKSFDGQATADNNHMTTYNNHTTTYYNYWKNKKLNTYKKSKILFISKKFKLEGKHNYILHAKIPNSKTIWPQLERKI